MKNLCESMKPVEDIKINSTTSIKELVEEFSKIGGFMGKRTYQAYEILKEVYTKDCCVTLSFTANKMATGLRGIFIELVKRSMVNCIITTCGSWDHDIARTLGKYYQGEFELNDVELKNKEISRLGNVLVPLESYGLKVEEFMKELLEELYQNGVKEISSHELSWEIGKKLNNENSLFYWCYKNKIPVIVPGFYDGAVGSHVFFFQETHKDFKVNLYKDEKLLSDKVFEKELLVAICIGGGISKHHTIWWAQFRGGLDYSVYFTSANEWDGSLSGAQPREAISWNKLKEKAKHVIVIGDATITVPLVFGALFE